MQNDKQLPQPTAPTPRPSVTAKKPIGQKPPTKLRGVALIFFCFVASVVGSSLVLMSQGDLRRVTGDHSVTRQVVSNEAELIATIAEDMGKSTVSISTESISPSGFFGGSVQEGAGTGIVVSADGYILTNRHVIPEGVRAVNVIFSDGTEYEDVRVVGRDSLNDIAFLKIEGVDDLTPAKIGESSDVEVGQKVIAVGNALGQFQNTVTTGVISGLGRPIVAQDGGDVERLENLFQTDAAINPGNSGGPLVNLDGEVIGVNTAVAQGAEGIGFAIPINDVRGLIDSVKREGRLVRAYLGVQAITLSPLVARELEVEQTDGAYIVEDGVMAGSPADSAGLRAEDIIVRVNDQSVDRNNGLSGVISRFKPGDEVTLVIIRDGTEQTLTATLEELPGGN